MLINKAESSDLESICTIDAMVIGNDRRRDYLSKAVANQECVIAKLNGEAVGFAVCDCSFFGYPYLTLIIVNPQFRRQGIAKALISYIENNTKSEKLFTSTNESNITMQKVCDSLGYIRSGIIENLDDGDPELIYFKRLEPNKHEK